MKKIFILLAFIAGRLSPSFAQMPILNSLPGASAVIFLDFDGHTVNNTSWNYDGPILCGSSGLNNVQITEIFNRVAEDYRPFDVNITTDSTKYLQAPYNKRMRAVVTISSTWYGVPAGGVSFVGSFTWGDDSPCFIFSQLLNYNVKNISETCSHEIGHTLGLYHQAVYDNNCVKVSEYNYGNGSGEIGWAPIMGVGYYRNLTLWNNGPNPYGCTNYQNDLTVITGQNGFGFRNDDYAETFAGASALNFVSGQFNITGIIERNTDKDMFKVVISTPGRFRLSAIPNNTGADNAGANLDLQVSLYNNTQSLVNIYNPGTLLGSVMDTNLLAGTYYIKVEGRGNIYTPDYASLGQYSLQGIFNQANVLAVHKLLLKGHTADKSHLLNWEIEADETLTKQVIEVSEDGSHFHTLAEPGNTARVFDYIPFQQKPLQYRMRVYFSNGRDYYSNTILLAAGGNENGPRIIGTLVKDNLAIAAPGKYEYVIYDAGGSRILSGKTSGGITNVNAVTLSGGIYFVQLSDGVSVYKLRFVKMN